MQYSANISPANSAPFPLLLFLVPVLLGEDDRLLHRGEDQAQVACRIFLATATLQESNGLVIGGLGYTQVSISSTLLVSITHLVVPFTPIIVFPFLCPIFTPICICIFSPMFGSQP